MGVYSEQWITTTERKTTTGTENKLHVCELKEGKHLI